MTPQAIIEHVMADGVRLALSPNGKLKASGNQGAVNRWLPIIREHKADIVAALVQGDWLAAWRELAALTSGLTADDPRLPVVMAALNACDDAYLSGDWIAFRQAVTRVRSAVEGRNLRAEP